MKRSIFLIILLLSIINYAAAQNLFLSTTAFINMLSAEQKNKAIYPLDTAERFRFNYIPLEDRKGISFRELTGAQINAAVNMLKVCVTQQTVYKIASIMQLENVLKEMEHRKAEDNFRDSVKYFITIFGMPGEKNNWAWRLEGHHVSFNFTVKDNVLVAGTPGFLGCNPGIVQQGAQKNKAVLKEETTMGFNFIQALGKAEIKLALVDSIAPNEIITKANRQAFIDHPVGIKYSELSINNQQLFMQLLGIYLHRYSKPFAAIMLKEIEDAGLGNLWFTWAGNTENVLGKACYYRIQGPTIIIEYDNSQNNANHIHTVIRDLKNDFGGDLLLEHYNTAHGKTNG